jgi:hypothetical protein
LLLSFRLACSSQRLVCKNTACTQKLLLHFESPADPNKAVAIREQHATACASLKDVVVWLPALPPMCYKILRLTLDSRKQLLHNYVKTLTRSCGYQASRFAEAKVPRASHRLPSTLQYQEVPLELEPQPNRQEKIPPFQRSEHFGLNSNSLRCITYHDSIALLQTWLC